MKKYVVLALGLLMVSMGARAAACQNGTAGAAGTDIVGVDGHHYCRSNITMNWWSAFAWCEGAGMTLISLEDLTGKTERWRRQQTRPARILREKAQEIVGRRRCQTPTGHTIFRRAL